MASLARFQTYFQSVDHNTNNVNYWKYKKRCFVQTIGPFFGTLARFSGLLPLFFAFIQTKFNINKNNEVFTESKDDKDDADENPSNERTQFVRFRNACREGIVHVDHHQEKGQ